MEVILNSTSLQKPEAAELKVEEQSMSFLNSLQVELLETIFLLLEELRELRSQLHHAADYCETTFLKSQEKKEVMENTKEYICRALVTVVDHLGNVSANIEGIISQTNAFSVAESRIHCLKQRVFSCEQYADKLALTKMRWSEKLPRFHSRYLSAPPILERLSSEKLRDSKGDVPSKLEDKEEDLPLFMYTMKPHSAKSLKPATATINQHNNLAKVVPIRNGLSVLTKVSNPTFHFQGTQKDARHRRSFNGSDILWLIRRTKRTK